MIAALGSENIWEVGVIVNMLLICMSVILKCILNYCKYTDIRYITNHNSRTSTWLNLKKMVHVYFRRMPFAILFGLLLGFKKRNIFYNHIDNEGLHRISSHSFIFFIAKERTSTLMQPLLLVEYI